MRATTCPHARARTPRARTPHASTQRCRDAARVSCSRHATRAGSDERTTTSRRSAALALLAIVNGVNSAKPASALEGQTDDVDEQVAANAALETVMVARVELRSVQATLERAVAQNTNVDWKALKASIKNSSMGSYPKITLPLDRVIGPLPLEAWEQRTWGTMPDNLDEGTSTPLPQLDRPNAVACAIFSCIDDPRQLASTISNASLKMLVDGVEMGARGDQRVTAAGLLNNVEDVASKMDLYIGFAKNKLRGSTSVTE
ncbi:hypothetical protein PPROV_000925500 [Pycnococcus provasolii]|uniref:Uncharacterized protein n=1 Tax=Pycnococcus provasolii TaxID=41880 RepID=A0A830HTK6_9CHLO|nr:hypothetical protein PPROV_000925500 [Pycnococcus provasolii]